MEQSNQISQFVMLAINVLLGLVCSLGAMWIRRLEVDMKDLRDAHTKAMDSASLRELRLQEQLNDRYVAKEDFREFRNEIRDNFREVFGKIDLVVDRLPPKREAT